MRDIEKFAQWLSRLLLAGVAIGIGRAVFGAIFAAVLVNYGQTWATGLPQPGESQPTFSQPILSLLVGMLIGLAVCVLMALAKGKWRF